MKIAIMESLGISAQELKACMAPFEQEGYTFRSIDGLFP